MISKHVSRALALSLAVWVASSPGYAAPPDPVLPDSVATTRDERAILEARLQKIEATLEFILHRLGEGKADHDPNRGPNNSGGPKASSPRPLNRPSSESTRGEEGILDATDRRYGIIYENGHPALQAVEPSSGKVIWQSELGSGASVGDKAVWQLSRTDDGKLLRVEALSEDSSLAFTIDAETGRTVKQEISANGSPRVTVVGPRRFPTGSSNTRYIPPAAPRIPPTMPTSGAQQGELVDLATSYIDAIGNLKLARSKYEQLKALRGPAAASASELESAAIHLETAQQKVTLLTTVAEAACETAKADLDFAEKMSANGLMTSNQVAALKAKVKTLESIVQQRSSANSTLPNVGPSSFTPTRK